MSGRLVQPVLLAPALPPNSMGLSALQRAKERFEAEVAKAKKRLRNKLKGLVGGDVPKVC